MLITKASFWKSKVEVASITVRFSLLFTVATVFSLIHFEAVAQSQLRVVDDVSVMVRSGPGSNFQFLRMLPSGSVVDQLEEQDTWAKVSLPDGSTGYVNSLYMALDEPHVASSSMLDKSYNLPEPYITFGHPAKVHSIDFNPDGTSLATGSESEARIWDSETGRELLVLRTGARVQSIAFNGSGTELATGLANGKVKVFSTSTGQERLLLDQHTRQVSDLAFSPDDNLLATSSRDGTVRLWDVNTGQVKRVLNGHNKAVLSVVFSPDGKLLATGSRDMTVRLWNTYSGRQLQMIEEQTHINTSVVFSPDGSNLTTINKSGAIQRWDVATGDKLNSFGDSKLSIALAYGLDKNTLVSGDLDAVRLWNAETGQELRKFDEAESVSDVIISPNGRTMGIVSSEGTARIVDIATGRVIRKIEGHFLPLHDAAFSPNGGKMITAANESLIRLWDVVSGHEIMTLNERGRNSVLSVAYSPNGETVATGSVDNTARIWELSSGNQIAILGEHQRAVSNVVFNPLGSILATTAGNKAFMWDVRSGDKLQALEGHKGSIETLAFSPDGEMLATGSQDYTIRLWDVLLGKVIRLIEGGADSQAVQSVSFSPDGLVLASASGDNAYLWDVDTGRQLNVFKGHSDRIRRISFGASGKSIATSSDDKTVRLWDVNSGQVLQVFETHDGVVKDVEFNPDGNSLATVSEDGLVRLWDTQFTDSNTQSSGEVLASNYTMLSDSRADSSNRKWILVGKLDGHTANVKHLSFNPRGNILASAAWDYHVRLWDMSSNQVKHVLDKHTIFINSVAFSPDGSTVATGADDNNIHIWDVESGNHIAQYDNHTKQVKALAFSSDGQTLFSLSKDNSLRFWNVLNNRQVQSVVVDTSKLSYAEFSSDGSLLALGLSNGTVRLLETESGLPLRELSGHTKKISDIVFSKDGLRILTASRDKSVRLWSTETGELVHALNEGVYTSDIAFGRNGLAIATTSTDNSVRLWDSLTGSELNSFAEPRAESVAISPNGRLLVVGFNGGDIRLLGLTSRVPDVEVPTVQPGLEPIDPEEEFQEVSIVDHCRIIKLNADDRQGQAQQDEVGDPNQYLGSIFCKAVDFSIARFARLLEQEGLTGRSVESTCRSTRSQMRSVMDALSDTSIDTIRRRVSDINSGLQLNGVGIEDFGVLCLSTGYKSDSASIALTGALMLVGEGVRPYGEFIGHHLRGGLAVPTDVSAARDWYQESLEALEQGDDAVYLSRSSDARVVLMRKAIELLSD